MKLGSVALKRGVVSSENALLDWYKKTVVPAEPVTLVITLQDSETKPIRIWNFQNAYPVKWTSGDLNASSTEMLTETLEVAPFPA